MNMMFMYRKIAILLALMTLALVCQASDLVQSVPFNAPAYKQMRTLAHAGMLADADSVRLLVNSDDPLRQLTRYDFALALLEPMEQLTALVECQDTLQPAPELRRRRDQAVDVAKRLNADEFNALLLSITQLSKEFNDTITEISPALPARANAALTKLVGPKYRTWLNPVAPPAVEGALPVIHLRVTPTTIGGDPSMTSLLISPSRADDAARLMFAPTPGLSNGVTSRTPMNSFEAAVDATLGQFRLYGMLGSAAGNNMAVPSKAGVGMEIGLGRIYALGITGILEYHISRGTAPGMQDINAGAVGGIGVKW